MRAILKNYHQPPRKVRLVADLIRGKSVRQAQNALLFLDKKSAPVLSKLLNSAVANAQKSGASAEGLVIKSISVDKGAVMRRVRPFSRGRSGMIRKTMSIVKLELAPISNAKSKIQKSK